MNVTDGPGTPPRVIHLRVKLQDLIVSEHHLAYVDLHGKYQWPGNIGTVSPADS